MEREKNYRLQQALDNIPPPPAVVISLPPPPVMNRLTTIGTQTAATVSTQTTATPTTTIEPSSSRPPPSMTFPRQSQPPSVSGQSQRGTPRTQAEVQMRLQAFSHSAPSSPYQSSVGSQHYNSNTMFQTQSKIEAQQISLQSQQQQQYIQLMEQLEQQRRATEASEQRAQYWQQVAHTEQLKVSHTLVIKHSESGEEHESSKVNPLKHDSNTFKLPTNTTIEGFRRLYPLSYISNIYGNL